MIKPKIAIVISHPIQHFCPLYRWLASCHEWDLNVYFASAFGAMPSFDKEFQRTIAWSNLQLETFSHEFLNGMQSIPISDALDAKDLDCRLKFYDPDIVIVYGYSLKLYRHAIIWSSRHSKAIFMISDAELKTKRNFIKKAVKKIILPKILDKVKAFLTTGDLNEDYYASYNVKSCKFFRSPFPIDIDIYQNAWMNYETYRGQKREELGISGDQIVLSVVGKLEPRKRQIDIIQALGKLDIPTKSIILLIIGSGEKESELQIISGQQNTQQIQFVGFIPPEELPGFYAATDIYVHPSLYDPHPLAISEAIFMGCPVIVSNSVGSIGPTDDVQPGRNAFVYNSKQVFHLSQMLERLILDPCLRRNFGRESHNIAVYNQEQAYGVGIRAAITSLGYI